MNPRLCTSPTPPAAALSNAPPRHHRRSARAYLALGPLLIGALLAGCDRTEPRVPVPVTGAVAAPSDAGLPVSSSDPSVPDAKRALAEQDANRAAAAAQSGSPASGATSVESTQMPLPGQANNHSLPNSTERAGQGDAPLTAASAPGAK